MPLHRTLPALVAAALCAPLLVLLPAAPADAAVQPDRVEDRLDRREDRRDLREDRRDVREDVRDAREDRWDRREDVYDRREDRWDRREDRWDRREDYRDRHYVYHPEPYRRGYDRRYYERRYYDRHLRYHRRYYDRGYDRARFHYRGDICRADGEDVLIGALIGAILGAAVSDGDGGAAFAGGLLGGALGASLSDCDRAQYHYAAYRAGRYGDPWYWRNPRTDVRGVVIPGRWTRHRGARCRVGDAEIFLPSGRVVYDRVLVCRTRGGWEVVG